MARVYSRAELLSAIHPAELIQKDQGKCMKSFRQARKLIFEQVKDERRHYPFRVATNISEFYDTFASVLTAEEKQEVARAAKQISDRIGSLPDDRQQQRYVVECRKAMARVLELERAEPRTPLEPGPDARK